MTGFGQSDAGGFHVEIKGVNHRYRDIRVRLPRDLSCLEIPVRDLVQDRIARGKVEVNITRGSSIDEQAGLAVNRDLAGKYYADLTELAAEFGGEVTFRDILALPGVMAEATPDAREQWRVIEEGVIAALDSFTAAREEEGGRLGQDISARIQTLIRMHADMEKIAPSMVDAYRERLTTWLQELLGEKAELIDQTRLEQEVAIMADRSDITEELVRLSSHLTTFRDLIAYPGISVGRRLDFMLQEINRELNTIGSKSQSVALSHAVIEAKAEVEKIREQVQNIE